MAFLEKVGRLSSSAATAWMTLAGAGGFDTALSFGGGFAFLLKDIGVASIFKPDATLVPLPYKGSLESGAGNIHGGSSSLLARVLRIIFCSAMTLSMSSPSFSRSWLTPLSGTSSSKGALGDATTDLVRLRRKPRSDLGL